MNVLGHLVFLLLYCAAAAGIVVFVPDLQFGVSQEQALVMAGFCVLGGGLLHQVLAAAARRRYHAGQIAALRRAYGYLEDELTWTRREVKAVREALEAVAGSSKAAQGTAVVDDVVTEVNVLESLVERLAARKQAIAQPAAAAAGTVLAIGDPAVRPSVRAPIPVGRAVEPQDPANDAAVLDAVRAALRDDRIDLVLQPIVSLPQRKHRFYECFSRLRADDGTVLVPEQYIAIAEESGLITAIDNMLLFRCIQLLRKVRHRNQALGFFCNLSPHTLGDEDFFGDFVEFLEANDELAPNLIFEIAQDDLEQHGPAERRHLDRLAILGCHFSMDRVQSLEVDPQALAQRQIRFIKFDAGALAQQSTVAKLNKLRDLMADLDAHRIDVIAEKIEDEKTLLEVLDFEIDFGQGYLFGEPRPAGSSD